jgi:hypothetical protein
MMGADGVPAVRSGSTFSSRAPSESSAVRSCAASISPCMRNRRIRRTALRVSSGSRTSGARLIGSGNATASRAACAGVSSRAEQPNQWRAAASAPNTPSPHSTTFR